MNCWTFLLHYTEQVRTASHFTSIVPIDSFSFRLTLSFSSFSLFTTISMTLETSCCFPNISSRSGRREKKSFLFFFSFFFCFSSLRRRFCLISLRVIDRSKTMPRKSFSFADWQWVCPKFFCTGWNRVIWSSRRKTTATVRLRWRNRRQKIRRKKRSF